MAENLSNDSGKIAIAKRLILKMAGSNLERWDKLVSSADSYVNNPSDGRSYRIKVVGGRDLERLTKDSINYSSVETFFTIYKDGLEDTVFSVNELIPDDYSYISKADIDSLKVIDPEKNKDAMMLTN